jgi:hypothetical protein
MNIVQLCFLEIKNQLKLKKKCHWKTTTTTTITTTKNNNNNNNNNN